MKVFAYQPCLGCVKCKPGTSGFLRMLWVPWVHLCTAGVTLLVAAGMKCARCSHTTFANGHAPSGASGAPEG